MIGSPIPDFSIVPWAWGVVLAVFALTGIVVAARQR